MSLNLINPFMKFASGGGGVPFYQLLDRTSLGSANDVIAVSGFAEKENLLILGHTINSGNTNVFFRCNGDSGTNYAENGQINGGTNYTQASQAQLDLSGGAEAKPMFIVQNITNISDKEKLSINNCNNCATGVSSVSNRIELVGKWANTSDAISSVSYNNTSSGSYEAQSEVVVLGYNNDGSGSSIWEELATNSETSGQNTATFTAKKYLLVQFFVENSGSIQPELIMGSGGSIDTGNNFSSRGSINGASDWTRNTQDSIETEDNTGNPIYCEFFICNTSDEEKLAIGHYNYRYTAGAGTSPGQIQVVGKWANTSAQANILGFKDSGAGSFTNSTLRIWGFD